MESAAAEALIKGDGQYQGVAVAVGALVLVAALYLVAEKYKTTRVQKHWEEVCRQTLRRRNNLKHKVLQGNRDAVKVRIKDWGVHLVCATRHPCDVGCCLLDQRCTNMPGVSA